VHTFGSWLKIIFFGKMVKKSLKRARNIINIISSGVCFLMPFTRPFEDFQFCRKSPHKIAVAYKNSKMFLIFDKKLSI
jgi:hypothetical protein